MDKKRIEARIEQLEKELKELDPYIMGLIELPREPFNRMRKKVKKLREQLLQAYRDYYIATPKTKPND
jgi:hypothetical protein